MTIALFPHQIKGAQFLTAHTGTRGLFFGMGTGKTITALEGVRTLMERTGDMPRVLVIAPPIALPMWLNEAQKYLSIGAQLSLILKTGKMPIPKGCKFMVVSYAIAAARSVELADWLEGAGVLICDESHALKNSTAKRTKAILGTGGIASGSLYSWMLTGTPITRWNDDMYTFICRADLAGMQEELGGTSLEKFQLKYTIRQKKVFPGARFPVLMVIGNRQTDDLADWVYGNELAMRVDLQEVFDNMPPLTKSKYEIPINADAELKELLKELEQNSIADIQKRLQSKEPALATLRRKLGMAKVKAAVAEISERIESGQNVLIGAWHTDVIEALFGTLADRGYIGSIIDGSRSSANKSETQALWNEGGLQFVVAQIAAAGVSLNLQHGGTQIIIVEEDWSPAIMDQFYARLWRYGQEKHVHVDTLVSNTKLDRALGDISTAKARGHEKFNAVGRQQQGD
jgi:SNF2 family DNA or RNA helicase